MARGQARGGEKSSGSVYWLSSPPSAPGCSYYGPSTECTPHHLLQSRTGVFQSLSILNTPHQAPAQRQASPTTPRHSPIYSTHTSHDAECLCGRSRQGAAIAAGGGTRRGAGVRQPGEASSKQAPASCSRVAIAMAQKNPTSTLPLLTSLDLRTNLPPHARRRTNRRCSLVGVACCLLGAEQSAVEPMHHKPMHHPSHADATTKVICQGLTGKNGTFHTQQVRGWHGAQPTGACVHVVMQRAWAHGTQTHGAATQPQRHHDHARTRTHAQRRLSSTAPKWWAA